MGTSAAALSLTHHDFREDDHCNVRPLTEAEAKLIDVAEKRVAADPDDATAHYQLAVLLLATRDLYEFYLPDETGVLARADRLLTRATELDPSHAPSHAKLGFTLHQLGEELERALASFKTARRLDPKNKTVDVYVPTILAEMEREKEALAEVEAVGRRQKVKLAALRKELAKAKFPADAETLLLNGFIRARNFFWSETWDEAERIRNSLERGRKRRVAQEELDECERMRHELEQSFDASRVPAAVRALAPAASRYGIGDDACRPILMKRIPKKERAQLIKRADRLAGKVDEWLNSFGGGDKMSDEAAAFMYLMNGVDEIR